eukprot:6194240-Pleurochrysis_carterae.AAC.1
MQPKPPALPAKARVLGPVMLLGGVCNFTCLRIDKRCWLLVQLKFGEILDNSLVPPNNTSVKLVKHH